MEPGSERKKGEYLDMDEDKRQQLEQEGQEYIDDAPQMPNMNAEAHDPDSGPAAPDAADRVES